MANDILIIPASASIEFSGSAANTIRLIVEDSGSVAFYGDSGSLFGISDSLSGSLMSVNDISGFPILEVTSDDTVTMGTWSANTLVVTGSNVGIGTATPTQKLSVNGSISASGDVTASAFVGDGSQLTNLASANLDNNSVSYGGVSLNLGQTDATPAFNLTDATSLPIVAGTTGTLTVARGGTGRTTLDSNQLLTGDGTNAVVSEGNLTFDGSKLTVTGEVSASGDGVFDGLVGIGLSSPIVPLHISRVAGSSTFTRFTREDLTNESWDMRISSAGVLEIRSVEDAGTSVLTPFRIEHATGEIWMTTGNVGIGTTSPTADLHISGSTADNDIFYVQGGTTDIIFASGSGNVGIGTITPDQALHVVGEIVATGEITAFYSSDERLKENIQILSTPLTKLTSLRGVEFDWTDEHIDSRGGLDKLYVQKHDVGVIAQEVEKVLPEVVVDRDDGYKAVRYEKMIPLLIEAIKELKTELDEVKQNCRCNSQLEE